MDGLLPEDGVWILVLTTLSSLDQIHLSLFLTTAFSNIFTGSSLSLS
jgi:hypothetical protein